MYFKSCLIMGCGPLKGKERKNATVAQELLSEETRQQLLKQEELWQTQSRKRNKENCILDSSGGGCCFLDTFSFKQRDDSKCPPSSLISAGSGLGPCCSSSCTPPGCLPVCRANCGIANGLWDAKMMLRFYNLPQLFTAWKPARLHHLLSLLKDKIKNKLKSAVKKPIVTVLEAFQGNQVATSGSFHHVTQVLFAVLPIAIVSWAYGN